MDKATNNFTAILPYLQGQKFLYMEAECFIFYSRSEFYKVVKALKMNLFAFVILLGIAINNYDAIKGRLPETILKSAGKAHLISSPK